VGSNPTRRIFVRSKEELARVRALALAGLNQCEIARRTGIPRSTVGEWLREKRTVGVALPAGVETCPSCGHDDHRPDLLPAPKYAYLLGLYLGDGCISAAPRGVYRLRIALDLRYPGIIRECADAIRAVRPLNVVNVQHCASGGRMAEVHSYSKAWPCLFPQHGPGRKHRRRIILRDWQKTIVESEPRSLVRGLIHSDGCRVINKSMGREYVRYFFDQHSDDVRDIFCWACDLLDLGWRQPKWKTISIARREDVALLDEFVGPKS
jgi:hypothetical protein